VNLFGIPFEEFLPELGGGKVLADATFTIFFQNLF
jgi:hypothetical protein